MVVAEQCAGAAHDLGRAAVVHAQWVCHCTREQVGVVDEERRVGAGVAVDALVVVADPEHIERWQGEQPQHQHVGRRQVLELVDQQVTARSLHRSAVLPIAEEHLEGRVDLLVEVDHTSFGEHGPVPGEHLGEAGDVVARGLHDLRVREAEPDRRQSFDVRSDRVGVRSPLTLSRDEGLHEATHLALLDHGRRRPAMPGQDPEPQRVEGPHPRPEIRGAGLHLQLRLLVVGDGQHGAWLVGPIDVKVSQPLGEYPGLPRAGRGDDPRRPGHVRHSRQLIVGQYGQLCRRGRRGGHDVEAAELHRFGVHDGKPLDVSRGPRATGTAVDPGRRAVGQHDVGGTIGGRRDAVVDAGGLDAPPPHRVAGPGVVGVVPHQEVQTVEPRLAARRQPPRLDGDGLRLAEGNRIETQLDHDRSAPCPCLVQTPDRGGRVDECGVVDLHHGRVSPRVGHSGPRADDDAATEGGGSGNRHIAQPT